MYISYVSYSILILTLTSAMILVSMTAAVPRPIAMMGVDGYGSCGIGYPFISLPVTIAATATLWEMTCSVSAANIHLLYQTSCGFRQ
ncbi:hypothetical protein F4815DRAFT_463191 [Daldinia loculata]|nr:hypothetical protein F4815DRAFT_463191 [Daldinia loculata]